MSSRRRYAVREYNKRIEKLLFKAVLLGLLILVVFQIVMLKDSVRMFLNYTTMLEGRSLRAEGMLMEEGYVCLSLENGTSLSGIELLLNGEPIASLDTRGVRVHVRNNDVLELDASRNKKGCAWVHVVEVSDNVMQPPVGLRTRAANKINLISRITIK